VKSRLLATVCLALCAAGLPSCHEGRPEAYPAPPVSFYREYVIVETARGRTRVDGTYYFRSAADEPLEIAIHYPFPVDRHHLYPLRIGARQLVDGEWKPLGYTRSATGIDWSMAFEPREERAVRVEYVQEIRRNHAIYIVTTTKQWGRPIEVAEFEFRIPADLSDVQLSFEPDREEVRGDTTLYYMKRTDFLPDEDLTVIWE
jgi:hypothetical protein